MIFIKTYILFGMYHFIEKYFKTMKGKNRTKKKQVQKLKRNFVKTSKGKKGGNKDKN